MKIVQIVPRVPPYTDGIGDYSNLLANQLLKDYGIFTHFLSFQDGKKTPSVLSGFPVTCIPEYHPEALLSVLPQDIGGIILQYGNYPYLRHKLDAPFWLATALEKAIQQRNIPGIVMFHELPTLKLGSFNILHPLQSLVSWRLGKVATTSLTNTAQFQAILSRSLKRPVSLIPNFCAIGEPNLPLPKLSERSPRMIVFGGNDRSRVYRRHLKPLLQTCQNLGLEEICDIGKPLNLDPDDFPGVRLTQMGFQPTEVIQELFLNSVAGFIDYSRFPGNIGKSSVFAAFCAHGLVPICSQYASAEKDGLERQKHYLVADQLFHEMSRSTLQQVANQAHEWYQRHNLKENTKIFASHLMPSLVKERAIEKTSLGNHIC